MAVAVIVVIFGAWTSPVIDADMARQMFGTAQLTPMNENIIIKASLALFDKNGSDVEVIMSPIMFAAWLGFDYVFEFVAGMAVGGGHMSRLSLDKSGIVLQRMQAWACWYC